MGLKLDMSILKANNKKVKEKSLDSEAPQVTVNKTPFRKRGYPLNLLKMH